MHLFLILSIKRQGIGPFVPVSYTHLDVYKRQEKGFADFDALVNAAADAEKRFYDLRAAIKTAEARMGEIQTLRTHIMNYSRTRSVYTGYRKAGYSKKYLSLIHI